MCLSRVTEDLKAGDDECKVRAEGEGVGPGPVQNSQRVSVEGRWSLDLGGREGASSHRNHPQGLDGQAAFGAVGLITTKRSTILVPIPRASHFGHWTLPFFSYRSVVVRSTDEHHPSSPSLWNSIRTFSVSWWYPSRLPCQHFPSSSRSERPSCYHTFIVFPVVASRFSTDYGNSKVSLVDPPYTSFLFLCIVASPDSRHL